MDAKLFTSTYCDLRDLVMRLHKYLFESKFLLLTNHKALKYIIWPDFSFQGYFRDIAAMDDLFVKLWLHHSLFPGKEIPKQIFGPGTSRDGQVHDSRHQLFSELAEPGDTGDSSHVRSQCYRP